MRDSTISELLSLHRPFHSNLQMDRLILARSGVTPFGLFKQCLRELHSRYHALCGMYIDRREAEQEQHADPLKRARARLRLDSAEHSFRDTAREFARFLAHAIALRPLIDVSRWEELDREEWHAQLRRSCALQRAVNRNVSISTLEDIAALPVAARESLLADACGDQSNALAWLANHEHAVPILPDEISLDDVRKMIEGDVEQLGLPEVRSAEIPVHSVASGPRTPLMGQPRVHAVSGGWSDSKINPCP